MSPNQCEVPESDPVGHSDAFEDVLAGMQSQKYWINFFVRPCCPPPGARQAQTLLDKRRAEVSGHPTYTDEQKAQLLQLIDEGEAWYKSTPFYK